MFKPTLLPITSVTRFQIIIKNNLHNMHSNHVYFPKEMLLYFLVLAHTDNCHCTQLVTRCQSLLTDPTH